MYTRRLLALLAAAAFCSASSAESWPSKPIRLVVPFPAGGGTDIIGETTAHLIRIGCIDALEVTYQDVVDRGTIPQTLDVDELL